MKDARKDRQEGNYVTDVKDMNGYDGHDEGKEG
jgi:hypothetical protein